MKIIQIMPEFGLAGAETMCKHLTLELHNMGHEVIVVSMYDYHSAITESLEQEGIKIVYLNKKKGLDLSMILKMTKLFRLVKPDVIHTHRYVMRYTTPAAILSGVKCRIHTVHNIANKEVTKSAQKLNKFFYKYCNVTPVAISEIVAKTINDVYDIDERKIPVVLNGIPLSTCKQKHEYDFSDNINILHIGRFSSQKNHDSLIRAFRIVHEKYDNTILQLIGEGELIDDIRCLAQDIGVSDSIQFLGTKANVHPYLENADVFVLPSFYEGIPMTLIEAMGTSLPIVVSNVGGVPDMLEDMSSAVFCGTTPSEIADAICKVLDSESLRRKIGTRAFEMSTKFSAKVMAEKYTSIYKSKLSMNKKI